MNGGDKWDFVLSWMARESDTWTLGLVDGGRSACAPAWKAEGSERARAELIGDSHVSTKGSVVSPNG